MAKRKQIDRNLARYALQGIEAGIEKLQRQAAELRRWLGTKASRGPTGAAVAVATTPRRRKRTMSVEARKRIGDAQRKRWAAQKANNRLRRGGAAGKPEPAAKSRKNK